MNTGALTILTLLLPLLGAVLAVAASDDDREAPPSVVALREDSQAPRVHRGAAPRTVAVASVNRTTREASRTHDATSRTEVETAAAVVALLRVPGAWSEAERAEVAARTAGMPTASLLVRLKVAAARGGTQLDDLRRRQADLALRVYEDDEAAGELAAAIAGGRAGRAGAAWARGALAAAHS